MPKAAKGSSTKTEEKKPEAVPKVEKTEKAPEKAPKKKK